VPEALRAADVVTMKSRHSTIATKARFSPMSTTLLEILAVIHVGGV